MKSSKYNYTVTLFRVVLSIVFIFSGFIKSIDPWGTAIKIGEYLSAMNLSYFESISLELSVLLCGGELLLGALLLFGVCKKLSSLAVLLMLSFMTLLTLWIAIWNPVADCGCFGDAIKLTNWETFFKNIVLLPMSITLWIAWSRVNYRALTTELISLGSICILAFGLCVYSLRHLPIIDFLPYKIGVNLLADFDSDTKEVTTKLIYKNIESKEVKEFTLEDTEWHDSSMWEYIDTVTEGEESELQIINEFALFDGKNFVTNDLLEGNKVLLISIWDMSKPISTKCMNNLVKLVDDLITLDYKIVCITPSSLEQYPSLKIGELDIKTLNIDSKTLKSTVRSEVGVIEVDGGIIIDKRSCSDAIE